MTTAYIALGSNVGDRLHNLGDALAAIAGLPETHVERASHVYESEPAYNLDQPAFANAVLAVETTLGPEQLLSQLQGIEDDLGRVRAEKHGARVIDLDILLYGDEEITSERLVVPHPGLLERHYVVTPLLDIAPRLHLPDGTRIDRENATVGAVIGDLGTIPDEGTVLNKPVLAEDWVAIAETSGDMDLMAGWDIGLRFKAEALEEAGIAHAWDPFEPENGVDPFGLPETFRLMVPVQDAGRATELLAELEAAKPEFPGDFGEMEDTDCEASL